MKFEELELNEDLKKSLKEAGFVELTPIQEKSIPYALQGRDITGLAQTGTGKTLAFLLPIVNKILNENLTDHVALILAPTRELVIQIAEEAKKLLKNTDKKVAVIIGGTDYKEQIQNMEDKYEIIVATPGRLLDHIHSGQLKLNKIQFFVLDEADRMFDMGFIKDIRFLMKKCPKEKQTLLFSATMSYYIIRLAADYLNDPVEISIVSETIVTENIEQKIIHLGREEKLPYLINMILNDQIDGQGIIFTNMKIFLPEIVNTLSKYGIPVTGISSQLDQKKRIRLLKDFRIGKYKYLVATDVASRGIDVDNIRVVYNYDLPSDTENYVHRIGRTARAGKKGKSISFCSEVDYVELEKIEKFINSKIDSLNIIEEFLKYPDGEFVPFQTEKMKSFPQKRKDKNNFKKDKFKKEFSNNKKDFKENKYKKTIPAKSEVELALEYLHKADSVLESEKGSKQNPNDKKNKNKNKTEYKKYNNLKKSDELNKNKDYDKSKRNLFDINDSKNTKPKKVSIWKKIKSLFGF